MSGSETEMAPELAAALVALRTNFELKVAARVNGTLSRREAEVRARRFMDGLLGIDGLADPVLPLSAAQDRFRRPAQPGRPAAAAGEPAAPDTAPLHPAAAVNRDTGLFAATIRAVGRALVRLFGPR